MGKKACIGTHGMGSPFSNVDIDYRYRLQRHGVSALKLKCDVDEERVAFLFLFKFATLCHLFSSWVGRCIDVVLSLDFTLYKVFLHFSP